VKCNIALTNKYAQIILCSSAYSDPMLPVYILHISNLITDYIKIKYVSSFRLYTYTVSRWSVEDILSEIPQTCSKWQILSFLNDK